MIKWINIDYNGPEYHTKVWVSYKCDNGEFGIATASLKYNNTKGSYWNVDFPSLRGEDYDEEDYVITHWFPYQDELNYPDEYEIENPIEVEFKKK